MALRRSGAALVTAVLATAALLPVLRPDAERRQPARAADPAAARAALDRLPLSFVPAGDGYAARGGGFELRLDQGAAVLALDRGGRRDPALLRTEFVGAAKRRPGAEAKLPGVINQFRGPKSEWRTNIPTYGRIRYPAIYPGIDAVFKGAASELEYDFEVAPGADPSRILLELKGADSLRVTPAGDLMARAGGAAVRHARPVAFQEIGGRRTPVRAGFRLDGDRFGFDLGDYDRSKPLVIDPILSYSSYLGGARGEFAESVALGSDGSIYIAGSTSSTNYPVIGTRNTSRDDDDVLVLKLSPDGSTLVWANVIGGATQDTSTTTATDTAFDIAVDGTGNSYVVGSTGSSDFPSPVGQPSQDHVGACNAGGKEAFLLILGPAGSWTYGSCFGGAGDEEAFGVDVVRDPTAGVFARVAVVGESDSFNIWGAPAISGFSDDPNGGDSFLVEVEVENAGCSLPCRTMRHRTFLGSSLARSVAYGSGGVYLTGSANQFFPATSGSSAGAPDAYVAKFDPAVAGANSRIFAVQYGSDGFDGGHGIALDSSGNIYVVGDTSPDDSNPDDGNLPLADTQGNLLRGGGTDGFIAKFNSSGVIQQSTYVGGSGEDALDDIALQQNGSALAQYVVGTTDSGDQVGHNEIEGQSCVAGNQQIFVVKRIQGATPPGAIVSCLGGVTSENHNLSDDHGTGIAVPSNPLDGTITLTGWTRGSFPLVDAQQPGSSGPTYTDAVVAKVTQGGATITSTPPALLGNAAAAFAFQTDEGEMGFACNTPDGSGLLALGGTLSTGACGAATGAASYTGLADGTHKFEVATADAFGSQSEPVAHTFQVDRTLPAAFGGSFPGDGAAITSTTPVFTWSESTDPHGVGYTLVLDGQNVQTQAPPSCANGTCTARAASPIGNGAHTWRVLASDTAAPPNTRATPTYAFSVLDPVSSRFAIAPNPALAGRTVTFDGAASNDATHTITKFEWDLDGDGNFETDTGSGSTATRSYPTPGTYSASLRVTDTHGLTATSTQELRVNAPGLGGDQVGVSVNKGAQYTNKPDVVISIVAPANASALLVANDGGFVGALPQAVEPTVRWRLDSSGPERLPKTVYVRFLSGTFASSNYTDDIILDERPPVVDSAALAAPAGSAVAAAARKYRIRVKARDSNSGVAGVQVTASKRKPGKLLRYKPSLTVKAAARPKFIRAKDRAGNYSRWKKLR